MWLGIVMVALGVGSSAAALIHYRDSRQAEPFIRLTYRDGWSLS